MNQTNARSPRWSLMLLSLLCACAVVFSMALPFTAQALDVAKCTARPNADTGSDVLGGTETRITWEAQAADDESLSSISLTLPTGTGYTLDNARLTLLTGDDHMTRTSVPTTFTSDGETITAAFDQPTDAGGYYRIELYGIKFPASGGDMPIQASYVLANGTQEQAPSSTIAVTGVSPTKQLTNWLEEQPWVQSWNSVKFLKLFFNPILLVSSFPVVLQGFFMAIAIVLVAFPLAIPLGLILSFMRMSRFGILRGLASLYVNIVRGTPVFLQIYIAFFGLPLAGVQIPPFPLGVIVLAMNSAAYQCEIYRAGIQSISKGQFEAARSLGMTGAQTMAFVIIPQTVRRVLPTLTNEFILLYKDTSMLAAVGVMEVVMYAKTIVASTGSITPYIVAALFYLIITLPLAKLVGNLERRLASNDMGSAPSGKGGRKARREARAARRAAKREGIVEARIDGTAPNTLDSTEVSPERFSSM